jgi:Peptidase family S41/Tricorn protease C1 domain
VILVLLPLLASALDGYWLSDGYGLFVEAAGDKLQTYEITRVSCLPSRTLTKRADGQFAAGDSDPIFVSAGPEPDLLWFHSPDRASSVLFRRAAKRPTVCEKPTPNDPETNFEVFWNTFAEQHGFLKHRGVDWAATYKTFRPRVTAATTPEQLFDIFSAMIEPLHDAHTSIGAESIHRRFHGKKPGTLQLTDDDKRKTIEIIEQRYLEAPLRSGCDGHVRYGRLKANAGYLRINQFARYAPGGHFEDGARALDEALDAAFKDASQTRGLVIDVRINGGGADPYGVQIAGRLTDKTYIAFIKRARNDAANPDRWTEPQPAKAVPSNKPRFLGRVVELIGPDTVSAGETFTMALMGREPHIVRIGENTQGVYSDVLGRTLPNGWRFGLPNEIFLTEDGKDFEASGVPPDIRVPVFPRSDLDSNRDSALEKALTSLK